MIKKLINYFKELNSREDSEPRSKKLFGLAGLYNTPNEIIEAASVVAGKGYEKFDVYTPYPLHGMDDAMGMERPKVGYVSFAFGLTGMRSGASNDWMDDGNKLSEYYRRETFLCVAVFDSHNI